MREDLQKKDYEGRREIYLEKLETFCLFDNDFMKKCFEDSTVCVELVLRIILENPDLKVAESSHQYELTNLQGHSLGMDIFATDTEGRKYNIEVQRENSGAKVKRARYHSSLIDGNSLRKGEDFEALPETYVIFITESDVLGYGLPIYKINRCILQNGEVVRDAAHTIYVNGKNRDDTSLGRLMHDFSCTKAEDMYYKELADRVRTLKETEKGREKMCKIMDEIKEEGRIEGEKFGRVQERILLAKGLLADGNFTLEKISLLCHMTVNEVEKLAQTK